MKKSKLKIILDTDEMNDHRSRQIDEWYDPKENKGRLEFKTSVADIGNMDYNFCVLIHALIEQYLCFRNKISDEEVTKFDKEHTHCEDPGSHREAPYHTQHQVATDVEAMVSVALGIEWVKYGEQISKTMKKWKKKK